MLSLKLNAVKIAGEVFIQFAGWVLSILFLLPSMYGSIHWGHSQSEAVIEAL